MRKRSINISEIEEINFNSIFSMILRFFIVPAFIQALPKKRHCTVLRFHAQLAHTSAFFYNN